MRGIDAVGGPTSTAGCSDSTLPVVQAAADMARTAKIVPARKRASLPGWPEW
jgi:hypothetical protein